MRWSGNAGSVGGYRQIFRIIARKHESGRLEDLDVDRRIILKTVLNEYDESFWTRLIWLRTGTNGGVL
jgi:hypothetical protein